MPSKVVLVTGVSGELGGRLLARLGARLGLERVVGVDVSPPGARTRGSLGSAEFVRVDIRNPLIAKVLTSAEVDTVVHIGPSCSSPGWVGRAERKESAVIGTMRLLAACQNSPRVRKLVVASTTTVYGASARSRAVFTEDAELIPTTVSGYSKDAVELEGYVRGFARRRPDVDITTVRLADLLAPDFDTLFTRYFALPLIPTVLGFDARLQFLHTEDALAVLERAVLWDRPGVFNVAGGGTLALSQAIRRAGRIPLPTPRPAMPSVGAVLRGSRKAGLSADVVRLLNFGRVVDTARLTGEFGYTPRWTTRQAFDDVVVRRGTP